MNRLRQVRPLATAFLGALLALPAWAGPSGRDAGWVTPVIAGYGKVHPLPHAAVQPDPAVDYRLFVRVAAEGPPADAASPLGGLDRLARLVNLMGLSRVPPAHLHIVALLDQGALVAALDDAAYAKLTRVDHNPNLPLLHALHAAGVKLLVCGQALAGRGVPDDAVSPDVTITLSALTDMAVYGQRGYAYMQL